MAEPVKELTPEELSRKLFFGGVLHDISGGFMRGANTQLQGLLGMMQRPVESGQAIYQGVKGILEHPVDFAKSEYGRAKDALGAPGTAAQYLAEIANPRNPFGIGKIGQQGPLFGIVSPDVAKTLNTASRIPNDEIFKQAVANTPGASITQDGLLLKVARRQSPDMEGAQSLRTGNFYLPAGDKRMSYYTGKSGYGGSEKFEGDTLLRSPLFVKGATGGKAPEAAYDQLMGKGAYELMRGEVLRETGVGLFGDRNPGETARRVAAVMEKYGADGSLADEIVRNSRKGNTLPYAIQENIVAHAVRKAGYDGVLGYTKTKNGPVLSELFDVRETSYPARGIDPDIHEHYLRE